MTPNTTDTYRTLLDVLWRDRTLLRNVALIIAGSLLLTLSAKIKVPFYPVPMTMQTLAVMLIGFTFGWRMAGATVLFYLAQGAFGLPVFAGTPEKGIGLAYMMGPTGGYLLGFVLAAVLCGWLAERGWDRSPLRLVAAMILANGVIYLLGVAWLGSVVGWDKPVLAWGMIPFLYGDLLKIVLGAGLLTAGWKLLDR
ncbi:MAG: biotin transporter BioY [Gammaproteobacteria bacterium]|nr:biotin transporter BioY [Gammaproteobacteria bacterium]MDE0715189.1 biotin transporter BioY [Gammaproteobacteria bacterium]MXX17642.1 biotin transporter BioY [Gammaproteobacteria bacterium]MXY66557.1 biotin transporter BioY [Gammaproteobacteria bacterium]MYG66123.1 biotin transporter BioY [Gammaproteobacteria bacterium]